ncbi:MAG: VWA domain-containing protein [Blastocatellia bacterium]
MWVEIFRKAISEAVMTNSGLKAFAIVLSLSFLFVAGGPIQGQQPDNTKSALTINTDLVVTWAQITTRQDKSPVKGLGAEDFLLREEGKQQQISLVKEGQPLSVVILVDGWHCIVAPEHEFRQSREALRQLGEDAEIALMAWDSDVRLAQPFTVDTRIIAGQIEDRVCFFHALNGPEKVPRATREGGRPGEALYQAARYLEKAAPLERRKIIIVISSYSPKMWMAQTHPHTRDEMEDLLRKTGTTVYALFEEFRRGVSIDDFSPLTWALNRKDKQRQRSGGTLERAIDLTGGASLIARKKGDDEMLIKLTGLIRSSYTIGYYPQDTNFDGRFRRINLELSRSGRTKAGKVDIKTRVGYQALRPPKP